MEGGNFISLGLGLIIFSFCISSVLVVPFINLLYKLKFTRQKEAPKKGKIPLFDKLHDYKAGTPVGGGILIILIVSVLFLIIFYFSSFMGIYVRSAFELKAELLIIFATFLSFGLLGLSDDLMKIFGKGRPGEKYLGLTFGLSKKQKFIAQWILGFGIGFLIYRFLGIHMLHIPLLNYTIQLGIWYIPFAAFVIVSFSNAFNITDGLDGLASGLLVICLLAFLIIAYGSLDTPLSIFISIWIGVMMAFLYFNVWPARLFLGDAGALSFGAMLGVIGLLTGSLVALIVIGGIFVLELLSSGIQMAGWQIFRKRIFPLARIHHTFLAIGWEEPKIVIRAWLAGIILAIFGLWLATI